MSRTPRYFLPDIEPAIALAQSRGEERSSHSFCAPEEIAMDFAERRRGSSRDRFGRRIDEQENDRRRRVGDQRGSKNPI